MPTKAFNGRYKNKYTIAAFFEEKNIAKIAWPQNDANAESIINAEIFIKLSVVNGKREITVSQVVKTFGLVIIIRNACQKADLND